jgi:hypothetical protein
MAQLPWLYDCGTKMGMMEVTVLNAPNVVDISPDYLSLRPS